VTMNDPDVVERLRALRPRYDDPFVTNNVEIPLAMFRAGGSSRRISLFCRHDQPVPPVPESLGAPNL
jgi:hypothetical protein